MMVEVYCYCVFLDADRAMEWRKKYGYPENYSFSNKNERVDKES